jgi:hypothetical protein
MKDPESINPDRDPILLVSATEDGNRQSKN